MFPSPEIEEREDEHPHQIDEVPIETHDFDGLVVPLPAGEKAASVAVEISPPDLPSNDDQEKHAERHMRAVETCDQEKAGAKLGRTERIAPGTYPFVHDQLGPLESLHSHERGAKRRRHQHQDSGSNAIAAITEIDGHGHR